MVQLREPWQMRVMPMLGDTRRSFLTSRAHVDEGCCAFCVCHVFQKRKADKTLERDDFSSNRHPALAVFVCA